MKTLKLLLALMLVALSARAQNPVSVRSTNGFATNLTANGTFAGNGTQVTNVPGTYIDATAYPFNVPTDGISDCTTTLTNAMFSGALVGKPVFLPFGKYITQNLTLYTNMVLYGAPGTQLWQKTGQTGIYIIQDATSSNVSLFNFEIVGNQGADSGIPVSQYNTEGLRVNNIQEPNTSFHDLRIRGFGIADEHYGVSGGPISGISHIYNIECAFCASGFQFDAQAEYDTFININAHDCGAGIIAYGNNCTLLGPIALSCNTNVIEQGLAGAPQPHNSFIGGNLNHANMAALYISNANGGSFDGVQMLPPTGLITGSYGLDFTSCSMGWNTTSVLTVTNSTNIDFICPKTPYPTTPNGFTLVVTNSVNVNLMTNTISSSNLNADVNGNLLAANNMTVSALLFNPGHPNGSGPAIFQETTGGGRLGFTLGPGGWHIYANSFGANLLDVDNSGNWILDQGNLTLNSGSVSVAGTQTNNSTLLVNGAVGFGSTLQVAGVISGNGSGTTNVQVSNISGIKAGFTNVTAATSVAIVFTTPMPSTNYNVVLSGSAAALAGMFDSAHTTNGFTANFTIFTGGLEWSVILRTQ